MWEQRVIVFVQKYFITIFHLIICFIDWYININSIYETTKEKEID